MDREGSGINFKRIPTIVRQRRILKIDPTLLPRKEKDEDLRAVKLIKYKRDGTIEGRTCINGKPQRKCIPKEEASSPSMGLESLIITLIIDAQEEREIAILMSRGHI